MMFERLAPEQFDTIEGIPEPAENARLIGHEQAARMLAGAYRAGKLPHALLLAGPQGIGKATLAFHLARHLLSHPSAGLAPDELAKPDPVSPMFRQVATGAHPSVLHLTRPMNEKTKSFKTVVTVDEIRRVNRFLSLTSHDGSYRVVIVDPADDMNTNAANALLKNLEEPPARTLFILITHSIGRLLPTIRSRCQTILLQPLSAGELLSVLTGFEPGLPDEQTAREAIVERAAGSPRDAILLTQYGGLEISETVDRLVTGKTVDVAQTHRLADAVAARDQAIQFGIFNRHALDVVADAASHAARAGDLAKANRLSGCWQDTLKAIDEAETYNLDKKQHVLGLIHALHAAMHSP
jgi:DNA polymerase-3 subunit delta'